MQFVDPEIDIAISPGFLTWPSSMQGWWCFSRVLWW